MVRLWWIAFAANKPFPNPEKAKAGLKKHTETVRKKYGIKA
jgi:hypothetical protein